MRPESTYPRWETWHESVPAIGLTLFDHFQPGSNVALPTTWPATLTTSAFPLPSNGRVSSGESKFLTSACAISTPSVGTACGIQSYPRRPPATSGAGMGWYSTPGVCPPRPNSNSHQPGQLSGVGHGGSIDERC